MIEIAVGAASYISKGLETTFFKCTHWYYSSTVKSHATERYLGVVFNRNSEITLPHAQFSKQLRCKCYSKDKMKLKRTIINTFTTSLHDLTDFLSWFYCQRARRAKRPGWWDESSQSPVYEDEKLSISAHFELTIGILQEPNLRSSEEGLTLEIYLL